MHIVARKSNFYFFLWNQLIRFYFVDFCLFFHEWNNGRLYFTPKAAEQHISLLFEEDQPPHKKSRLCTLIKRMLCLKMSFKKLMRKEQVNEKQHSNFITNFGERDLIK